MALKIMPHGRLQEWPPRERGYFAAGDYGIHAAERDSAGEVRIGL